MDANGARLARVMYNLLEALRVCAILLTPFMPDSAAKVLGQIGASCEAESYGVCPCSTWESAAEYGKLKADVTVVRGENLFPRVDEAAMLAELEALREAAAKAAAPAADAASEKPEGLAVIGIDDFMKVELRTAQVISCEPVKKAKKLLCLQIDLGYEKRQVVSGIAKWYKPEDLIGKKLIVVANLAPAKLCGVESQGMILASGEEDVRVVFLDPETKLGERVR